MWVWITSLFDGIDDLRHDVRFKFRFLSLPGIVYRFFGCDEVQELGRGEEEILRHLGFIDFITPSAVHTPTQHADSYLLGILPICKR